jgi:peptidoglycan/LPS O-acetylase OafA/YrhL
MQELIADKNTTRRRFVVLDSWRGIAATMVMLFHFPVFSHLYGLAIIRQSWLFVDLFFVLSGFVITLAYVDRLRGLQEFAQFIAYRLARVYPLHVFVLALYVAGQLILLALDAWVDVPFKGPAFTGRQDPSAILPNLLLIHSFGVTEMLSWNFPSWSISAEFFAYILFAGAATMFRGFLFAALMIAALISFFVLVDQRGGIDADSSFGMVRAVYGFAFGAMFALCYKNRRTWYERLTPGKFVGSVAEVAAIATTLLFIGNVSVGPISLFAPFVFGLLIIVFSYESGVVSHVLLAKPFHRLGEISYSIYMLHAFVLGRMLDAGRAVESITDSSVFTLYGPENPQLLLGTDRWLGDAVTVVGIGSVIALAHLTYRYLEKPAGNAIRQYSDSWFARAVVVPE